MPPVQTDPQTTRERLLEAAGEVFAEHGFRGATVRAICQAAGANVGAVNYHFGGKRALYREVLRYAFERADERFPLEPPPAGAPAEARLRAFVQAFLGRLFSAGRSWHGRIMAREMADPSGALEELVQERFRPLLGHLEGLVGELRPDLAAERRRLHGLGLIAQCVFFRHCRPVLDVLFGPEAYGEADIPALTAHIVGAFLGGLEPRGEGGPAT